jgi:hypothetical protein|tara:strand:- start:125 stop:259 length:135 start_codon:yes stop_codon:yes gene_type:complete
MKNKKGKTVVGVMETSKTSKKKVKVKKHKKKAKVKYKKPSKSSY